MSFVGGDGCKPVGTILLYSFIESEVQALRRKKQEVEVILSRLCGQHTVQRYRCEKGE